MAGSDGGRLALVTSARGGLREIVGPNEAEAALIVAIEAALMSLTEDESARRAFAVRGRARAEALFDIRSVAASFDHALLWQVTFFVVKRSRASGKTSHPSPSRAFSPSMTLCCQAVSNS